MSRLALDRAIEDAQQYIEQRAVPDAMSQAEAVEFYETIGDFCRTWVRDIQADMKAAEKEPG